MDNESLEKIKQNALFILDSADMLDKFADTLNQRNEQWFINWQCQLNKISVRDGLESYQNSNNNVEGD